MLITGVLKNNIWEVIMDWTNISNIASILTIFGFIITVATLIFLFYQCQILKSSLRTQSFQNLFSNMINIDMFFANNPSAKLYVYDEKDLPKDTKSSDYIQAMSACELLLDHFEEIFGCKNVMSKEMWLGWSEYMRNVYNNSKALRQYIEINRSKYAKQFLELIDEESCL